MERFFFIGKRKTTGWIVFSNWLIILFLLSIFIWSGFNKLDYEIRWSSLYDYRWNFLQGSINTIIISAISLITSLIIGVFFGLSQKSSFLLLRYFSQTFIEIIRGTPLLVQILIFFYVIANAIGLDNRFISGIIIMSIFSGAYIAEIVRGGVESIGKSQWETGRAIGLSTIQIYRYIVFPQVITRILPSLAGQFVSLIKDSSLLSIIAIKEFTMAAREMNANTFSTLEAYIPLAIGYLILTIPISRLTRKIEKKYSFDT